MNEYRLRVGNAVIALVFGSERDRAASARYFSRPSDHGPADIQLSIRFRDDADERMEVPSSLFRTKLGNAERFSMAGGLIEGRYSPSSGEGELSVQRLITEGGYARIYEQVFYQAYWSAVWRKGLDSLLLHSSGVIHNGRGYAFSGRSGAGKSTVARLSPGATILNDEITAIDLSEPSVMIMDTPFNASFRGKKRGTAALGGILLLKQAPFHRLTRTTGLEPQKTLAREIIPPMGLETSFSPARFMDMFDLSQRLFKRIPFYIMEFQQDPRFWDLIETIGG